MIKCCLKTSWEVVVFLLLTFIGQSKINNYLWLRNPETECACELFMLAFIGINLAYLKYIINCSSKIIIFPFLSIVEGYIVVNNIFESELLPVKSLP